MSDKIQVLDAEMLPNAQMDFKPFSQNDLQSWHQDIDVSRHKITKLAKLVLLFVFCLGSIWASTAQLGGALIAVGKVITENRNRVIQHLEGGILSELYVQEGDKVSVGQPLALIDTTQVATRLSALEVTQAILRIQLARRQAEVDGASVVNMPSNLPAHILADARVTETIASQRGEFQASHNFVRGEIISLDARIENAISEIGAQKQVLDTYKKQADLFAKELVDYNELLEKGLVPKRQVFATERQYYGVLAQVKQTETRIVQLDGQIKDFQNEKGQVRLEQLRKAETEAVELQKQLNQVDQEIAQMQERFSRTQLRSPVDGTIHLINQRTLGGVVRPGETVMEIFPTLDRLRLEVRVRPADAKDVFIGQEAQIQFGAQFQEAPAEGKISHISQDVILTQDDPEGHYIAYVDLDATIAGRDFVPGNTAQVYLKTKTKTFFEILAGPLTRLEFSAFKG